MEESDARKFVKVDDEKQIHNIHAITFPDGKIFQVGIYQVMFGFRVVGYFQGANTFELNWCCGDNKIVVFATQKIIMNLLEQGVRIEDIPFSSDIKPWPKDKRFIERVSQLVKNPLFGDIVDVMDGTRPEI